MVPHLRHSLGEARRCTQSRERGDQHAEESLFTRAQALSGWRIVSPKKPRVGLQTFVVIDVQHPAHGPKQLILRRSCAAGRQTDLATHFCPAVAAGVDVLQLEAAALEIRAELDIAK